MAPKKSKSKGKAKTQGPATSNNQPPKSQDPPKHSLSDPVPPAALAALKKFHATKAIWDVEKMKEWQHIPECRPRDLPRDEISVPWFDKEMEEQQRIFLSKPFNPDEEEEESEVVKMVKEMKIKEAEEQKKKEEENERKGGPKYPIVDEDLLVAKLLGTEGLVVPSGFVEGGRKQRAAVGLGPR